MTQPNALPPFLRSGVFLRSQYVFHHGCRLPTAHRFVKCRLQAACVQERPLSPRTAAALRNSLLNFRPSKRFRNDVNHGGKSFNFNQDCAICRSRRCAGSGSDGLQRRGNRVNRRELRRKQATGSARSTACSDRSNPPPTEDVALSLCSGPACQLHKFMDPVSIRHHKRRWPHWRVYRPSARPGAGRHLSRTSGPVHLVDRRSIFNIASVVAVLVRSSAMPHVLIMYQVVGAVSDSARWPDHAHSRLQQRLVHDLHCRCSGTATQDASNQSQITAKYVYPLLLRHGQ